MALNSALYTGLSGLDVNQTRLNVVGNNIANSNTVAFKSSRALFVPQFYVTDQGATPASTDFGGLNPSQRGLGATVGSIQKDFTGGSIEPTGKPADLAINGDGFFVVDKGSAQSYTRDGAFQLNSGDQLTTQAGDFVMGYGVDSAGKVQVGTLTKLTIPLGQATLARATSEFDFTGNLSSTAGGASVLNSENFTTVGGSATPDLTTLATNLADASSSGTALFTVGQTLTVTGTKGGTALTPATLTIGSTTTLGDIASFYNTALGVDTSVGGNGTTIPDPGTTLKAGTATNSVQLVVAGNVGSANSITVTGGDFAFSEGSTGGTPSIDSNPSGTPVTTQFQGYDSLGNPITINLTASLASISPAGAIWNFSCTSPSNVGNPAATIGTGTLQFNAQGTLVNTTGSTISVSRDGTGAASPQSITLNFDNLGGLTDTTSSLQYTHQDGFPIGTLNSYTIGSDGTITGSYSNGLNQTLGQVAIATFRNNAGLSDSGGDLYTATAASGVAVIGTPLQLGAGSIQSGALELSNVDLSTEFTNLIIASTGFSASSKVITTSDQLIQDLLNASR